MRFLVPTVAVAFTLALAAPAASDDDPPPPSTTAKADEESFTIEAAQDGIKAGNAASSVASHSSATAEPAFSAGASACDGAEQIVDADGAFTGVSFCPGPEAPPSTVTAADARGAFARLDLPAAKLVIQPPDGLTLVNFDTNFYTTSTEPISRTVTLLGQQVTLEATPAEFQWAFGDGNSITTTEPGAPYPDLTVTHNYQHKGTYRPSLDTVFTGRYRVGGGAWQQIPGTVTIGGTPEALRAIEAQPKLVGY